jgi:hypothetical protein
MKHAWTNLLLPILSLEWTGLRVVGPKALSISNKSSIGPGSSDLSLADCLLEHRLLEHQNTYPFL